MGSPGGVFRGLLNVLALFGKRAEVATRLILNRLLYARMRDMVVVALYAKPIPTAFLTAVGANRDSAIRTLSNRLLAARKGIGSFTLPGFHLKMKHLRAPIPQMLVHNNANLGWAQCDVRARIVLRVLASENSYDSVF